MKLVVGLGNPGAKYEGTRHNVGFAVVDYLASGKGADRFRSRFQAQVAELNEEGVGQLLLVKPETFMNLSGRSVRQAVDFYKVPLSDLIVVADDMALPLGKLRVRAKGSHGGHNGLRDIQQQLGTDAYARLKIGVGEAAPGAAVDHVLGRFKPSERAAVEDAVAEAARAVLLWASRGAEACMNQVNGAGTERNRPGKGGGPDPKAGDGRPGPRN